jgi:catechol 2,3-dioxygenase-like lactoylglutathione lyase family enzyme
MKSPNVTSGDVAPVGGARAEHQVRAYTRGVRLNHVTVAVSDVERSVSFYEQLGLEQIVASYPSYARFVCPDGDSTISLAALPDGESLPPPTISVHFECDDLDGTVSDLKAGGIAFEQEPIDQPYLWREAILRDPDGNVIFLYSAGENRLNPPWRLRES